MRSIASFWTASVARLPCSRTCNKRCHNVDDSNDDMCLQSLPLAATQGTEQLWSIKHNSVDAI